MPQWGGSGSGISESDCDDVGEFYCQNTLTATVDPASPPAGHHYEYQWERYCGGWFNMGTSASQVVTQTCGQAYQYRVTAKLINTTTEEIVCSQIMTYIYNCPCEGSGSGSGSGG